MALFENYGPNSSLYANGAGHGGVNIAFPVRPVGSGFGPGVISGSVPDSSYVPGSSWAIPRAHPALPVSSVNPVAQYPGDESNGGFNSSGAPVASAPIYSTTPLTQDTGGSSLPSWIVWVLLAFGAVVAFGQDNSVSVKAFPGVTVSQKLTAAMLACNPDTTIPCTLVLEPSLAAFPEGTLPALCSQCSLLDYRKGLPGGGSSGGSSSGLPAIAKSGLLAEYTFSEGSGTVLHDYSGHGNDGTLASGANAPTWSAAGLSFVQASNQYVSLPASLNGAVSFQFLMYIKPVNQSNFAGYNVGSFFGSNVANLGNNFWLGNNAVGDAYPSLIATGKNNTGNNTATSVGAIGLHLVTIILDASADKIYIDGQQAAYTTQAGTYGAQTAAGGNYQIGTTVQYLGNTYSFTGTIVFTAIYSGALTAGQVAQNYAIISQYAGTRDLSTLNLPTVNFSGVNQLVADGDSLTYGYQGTPYTNLISLNGTWNKANTGVPSFFPVDNLVHAPYVVDPLFARTAAQNAVLIWTGTNGAIGAQVAVNYGMLVQYCLARRAAGWKVFVLTMISRTGQDAGKNTLNGLIRQNWRQFADVLVDVGENPVLGADGANTNGDFYSDHIHLLNAGDVLIASMVSNAVNAYYGNTEQAPTVVAGNSYASTAADNFVIQTPTAAATHTLIDCNGLTGMVRTITNASGSFAITVSGQGAQTITGSASIAANSTGKFLVTLVSPSAGGCVWTRIQ